jgi:hypothetical protein
VKQLYALSDFMVEKFEHNHDLHKNMNNGKVWHQLLKKTYKNHLATTKLIENNSHNTSTTISQLGE